MAPVPWSHTPSHSDKPPETQSKFFRCFHFHTPLFVQDHNGRTVNTDDSELGDNTAVRGYSELVFTRLAFDISSCNIARSERSTDPRVYCDLEE